MPSPSTSTLSARACGALLAALALSGVMFALLLGTGGPPPAARAGTPVIASDNVSLIGALPGTAAISGVFSRSAPYFYVSGADSVSVIDVKDPRSPQLVGKLVNAVFENEAMTLGERTLADGTIQRFVLVGNDLGQVTLSPSGSQLGRVGGLQLTVVDVTDPTAPKIAGQTPSAGDGAATTSTHTVACANAACTYAYSAGEEGEFSIIDLRDLSSPREVGTVVSPAAKGNEVFTRGAGHHWNIDGAGIAWHTGSGGTAAFDISDPLNPLLLTGTDEHGTKTPYNDFIHHNSMRPNAKAFAPGRPASVTNGNVVLVTEEDYANDGDEVVCSKAGTFQTWELRDLDGAAYRARNPKGEPNLGTMRPLDIINAPDEAGGGLTTPAGAFCSAHWFDYHPSGIVAQGYYQQGLRLIDVRDPRNLQQYGYATAGASQVWDAYWAPERDAAGAVVPGRKTNLVYTVDVVQGVHVYEVSGLPADLPSSGDSGDRGTFPSETPGTVAPAGTPAPLAGARTCSAPRSRINRNSRLLRTRTAVRGIARGVDCKLAAVHVAVGRKVGRACRYLQANGRFGERRDCRRPQYVKARGTSTWSLNRKAKLPRGRYLVWSRAVNRNGDVEPASATRNLLRTKVRSGR